jgi:NADH-ubiquinone oxidoreductase chain 5
LRWFGNLSHNMPVARSCVSLANLALCGFPFIAGFYSKDIIIEASVSIPNRFPIVILAILSLGLTSFYSIRFSMVTLWSSSSRPAFINIAEDMPIIKPILALSLTSICVGRMLSWLPPIRNFIYPIPNIVKFMPLEIVLIGVFIGWKITAQSASSKSKLITLPLNHYASCLIWFLVPLSTQFTIKFPYKAAHFSLKHIDQGWLEISSGINLNKYMLLVSNKLAFITPKSPISYLVVMMSSSITALCIYVMRC